MGLPPPIIIGLHAFIIIIGLNAIDFTFPVFVSSVYHALWRNRLEAVVT